jgi:predicted nucleotidyltransferase
MGSLILLQLNVRATTKKGPAPIKVALLVEFESPTYDNFFDLIMCLEKLFGRKVEVLTPDGVDSIRVPEVAQSIRDSVIYV